MEKNNNWIPVSGSAIGAMIGGIPGAIVGGIIGAVLKELFCPNCGKIMKHIGNNIFKCDSCGYAVQSK